LDQNPERQLGQVQVDKLFTDKASGKDTQRPQLYALLSFARDGDTVVVHSMDRLARNLDNLRRLVQTLTKRGIRIEFVKELLSFTERALIGERQREEIALAKRHGVYRGRKKALVDNQVVELRRRAGAGEQKSTLAREFGISRETLYQYFKVAPIS
jgi:DNA invertase Pin-like site-specific DNA recombinase